MKVRGGLFAPVFSLHPENAADGDSTAAGTAVVGTAAGGVSLAMLQQAASESDESYGNQVIVTGTRRVGRTVSDSPVPVDVITGEQLRQSGLTETARLLRDLVPSLNFPQPSITDGTDVIRPATLRGLGPDQTLVLLNGKRRHGTANLAVLGGAFQGAAAADLNYIPLAAIDHV